MINDLGLLILRVSISVMLLAGHGWGKLTHFSEYASTFPDPLHAGAKVSLCVAIAAEVGCSFLVAIGLYTRIAAFLPALMLFVAAAVVHVVDPWAKKEFALLYAIPFMVIVLTGPGSLSIDWMVRKKR